MRDIIKGAITGAAERMVDFKASQATREPLSTQEKVQRYERFHRGRPLAVLQFAKASAPPGVNPVSEAARYVAAMEDLRRSQWQT